MTTTIDVTDELLREWPLPKPSPESDKEDRGCTLVIAGSRELPGAALLASLGVLRAGAGKLVVATAESVAAVLAAALPEARVIGLPETSEGGLAINGVVRLTNLFEGVDAILVGPGWMATGRAFARCVMETQSTPTQFVLDASAMDAVKSRSSSSTALITPHAGEMARLLGITKEEVLQSAAEHALAAARRWECVVALKGATTFVATPSGGLWRHVANEPGLGTSGSGDVLAGLVSGLLARGAVPEQAAVWGVAIHARAGAALARRVGPVGYLAREILDQVPAILRDLSDPLSNSPEVTTQIPAPSVSYPGLA